MFAAAVGRERSLELTRLTAPHQLRRSAEINAKYLPPRAQYVLFCPLSPLQSALYSGFLRTDEMRSLLYGGTTTR
jgi:SNF2 family DNA or RNA helicase